MTSSHPEGRKFKHQEFQIQGFRSDRLARKRIRKHWESEVWTSLRIDIGVFKKNYEKIQSETDIIGRRIMCTGYNHQATAVKSLSECWRLPTVNRFYVPRERITEVFQLRTWIRLQSQP